MTRKHHVWCSAPDKPRSKCAQCDELYRRFRKVGESGWRERQAREPQFVAENTWFYYGDARIHIFHELSEAERLSPNPIEIEISLGPVRAALQPLT